MERYAEPGKVEWVESGGGPLVVVPETVLPFWTGADGWQPYGGARGRTIGTHAAEWWAQVRTADGTRGWIDAYASDLGNVDACGGPE